MNSSDRPRLIILFVLGPDPAQVTKVIVKGKPVIFLHLFTKPSSCFFPSCSTESVADISESKSRFSETGINYYPKNGSCKAYDICRCPAAVHRFYLLASGAEDPAPPNLNLNAPYSSSYSSLFSIS